MIDARAATDRPERHGQAIASSAFGVVEKPLSAWERIGNVGALRKLAILAVLALIWELYARWLDNPLLFPAFGVTVQAFAEAIRSGELPGKAWTSIKVLLVGYAAGILCAAILTVVAITTRFGTDLLEVGGGVLVIDTGRPPTRRVVEDPHAHGKCLDVRRSQLVPIISEWILRRTALRCGVPIQ